MDAIGAADDLKPARSGGRNGSRSAAVDVGVVDLADLAADDGGTGTGTGTGTDAGTGTGTGTGRKPRADKGRPRGPRAGGQATISLGVGVADSLKDVLAGVHLALSMALRVPEIALTEEQSKALAEATANVLRHYDMAVSVKAMDWTRLVMTLAAVYGTKAVMIRARMARDKERGGDQATT